MDAFSRSLARDLELDSGVRASDLRKEFRELGHARIRNFLTSSSAEALYHRLVSKVRWYTYVIANEKLMRAHRDEDECAVLQESIEILTYAYEGADLGFSCCYDADRHFPEDVITEEGVHPNTQVLSNDHSTDLLGCVDRFMNLEETQEVAKEVLGLNMIQSIALRAIRLRPGHFVTFNSATRFADRTGKRRAGFFLNLTPEWKPEWGGSLQFRTPRGGVIEGYLPMFNSLDLITFPHGYWINSISPFAKSQIIAIEGRVYGF